MSTPKDVAVVAAFMMEGLRDNDYDLVLSVWDNGAVGLVEEMVQYAEYCWDLAEAGLTVQPDWPGVFDYEVSSPFGVWFGERVIETGNAPTGGQCRVWLLNAVEGFFLQYEGDKENLELTNALAKALMDVKFPGDQA